MSASASAVKAKRTGSPLISIIAGLLLLFLFVIGTLLHIQTSEAFFLPVHSVAFSPDWSILSQPVGLARGEFSNRVTQAVIWGWAIEALFLACIAGYEVAHESVKYNNPKLAEVFRVVTLLLLGFDGYTDYLFTSATVGMWAAIAFSLMMCFIVFFFGTVGARFIEHGIKGLRA